MLFTTALLKTQYLNFWRTSVLNSTLGFKAGVDPLACVLHRLHAIDFTDPLTLQKVVGS